jgi:hypothetical protein
MQEPTEEYARVVQPFSEEALQVREAGEHLTYNWTPSTGLSSTTSPNPTATPSSFPATYIVTVTDAAGCIDRDTVIVRVSPPITVNAGSGRLICRGGSTVLGGSPTASGGTAPLSYNWSPSTGLSSSTVSNPTATVTATTTYTVTVTDSAGCTQTGTVLVRVSPDITANAGADRIICTGSSTTLGGSPQQPEEQLQ